MTLTLQTSIWLAQLVFSSSFFKSQRKRRCFSTAKRYLFQTKHEVTEVSNCKVVLRDAGRCALHSTHRRRAMCTPQQTQTQGDVHSTANTDTGRCALHSTHSADTDTGRCALHSTHRHRAMCTPQHTQTQGDVHSTANTDTGRWALHNTHSTDRHRQAVTGSRARYWV